MDITEPRDFGHERAVIIEKDGPISTEELLSKVKLLANAYNFVRTGS